MFIFILLAAATGILASSGGLSPIPLPNNAQNNLDGIVSSAGFTTSTNVVVEEQTKPFCMSQATLAEIRTRAPAFTCERTNIDRTIITDPDVEWVIGQENVLVDKINIHDAKKLILKEICGGINYYTWKGRPPNWGSLYTNTLWKLVGPNPNQPIQDGDSFDVFIRRDAAPDGYWICQSQSLSIANELSGYSDAINYFSTSDPALIASAMDVSPVNGEIININDSIALWNRTDKAFTDDIESAPTRKKLTELTINEFDYDVYTNLLKAFSTDETQTFYLIRKGILSETNSNIPGVVIYEAFNISKPLTPLITGSIQFGSFNPKPADPQDWHDSYLSE